MDTESEIRNFVQDVLAGAVGADIGALKDTDSLIDAGVLDSLAVLKLISFIDEDLGIELPLEDFLLEDFETVDKIFALIEKHR